MRSSLALCLFGINILGIARADGPACPASLPLGSFEITARPGDAADPRPLRSVNRIGPGFVLAYQPLAVAAEMQKQGQLAVILAPAEAGKPLQVFEPHSAAVAAQWPVPYRVAAVGMVFGPQGLDVRRVQSMLNRDRELVGQLAAYAEQTAQVENLVDTMATAERAPAANLDAAIAGFAERYGTSIPRFNPKARTDEQAQVLLRALLPALQSYDPLAPRQTTRMAQSAGLAASVAALFFGSNVGLAAGGAAMVQNLKTMLFPATEFRSALAQNDGPRGFALCAQRQPAKSRTRTAYLWAYRVPDRAAPELKLTGGTTVLAGTRAELEVEGDWRALERARDWRLVRGSEVYGIHAQPRNRGLTLDLTSRLTPPPGQYQLEAVWDWQPFALAGTVELREAADLSRAELDPASRDRLVADSGEVTLRLTGADFRWVSGAALGAREAAVLSRTDALELRTDTAGLRPGAQVLALRQADGKVSELRVTVHPPHPRLANLPLRANTGEAGQVLEVSGVGLERVVAIESPLARFELEPPRPGSRPLRVYLADSARPGDRADLALRLEGLLEPRIEKNALVVSGPRPRIRSFRQAAPESLGIALREGELPAGSHSSFSLLVEEAGGNPALELACGSTPLRLMPGDGSGPARLESAGRDVLFLSLDPAGVGRPGCVLTATLESSEGRSEQRNLGRVIRVPRIESFVLSDEPAGEGAYYGVLTGQDLEVIGKTGWQGGPGLEVEELPRPIAGAGTKHSLRVRLPWPAPAPRAALYIWLRGEHEGRVTSARY